MATRINGRKAQGHGRRIRSVDERVKVAEGDGRRSLSARRERLYAAIAEIDTGMASAIKREEKRCGSEALFDDKSIENLANRATTTSAMDAFAKIAEEGVDIFDEGAKKYLAAVSAADAKVAAAPEGEKALDLDFFTGKEGVAQLAVDKDGKVDDAGSAVVRMIGRRHKSSMTADATTFMAEFTIAYQADLSARQAQEQRQKEAQQFLDSENEAALIAWEQDKATADKIRDDHSNFNQQIENVKSRRDVHLETKHEVKEHREELKVEKEELGERDESVERHQAHQELHQVEDDFRDGAGRVTRSEGRKRAQKPNS